MLIILKGTVNGADHVYGRLPHFDKGKWVYLENSVCEIWKPLYQFRIFKSQSVF